MPDQVVEVVITNEEQVQVIRVNEGGYSGWSGISTSGYSGYSGFSSKSGYSGFSGNSTSGYSGFSSQSGFSGYSGFSGGSTSGYSGFCGLSGYSGFSSNSGYSGFSGRSGYSGFSAFSGFCGTSGYSGKSGFSGYSGEGGSGYSGFCGKSGYSGYSGFSGFSGFSGKSGYSGYSGYSGFSGNSPQYGVSAGQSVTSTSLVDITGLTFSIVAGTYIFESELHGNCATGTDGCKMGINFSATYTSGDYLASGIASGTTIAQSVRGTANNTGTGTFMTTDGAEGWTRISGRVVVADSGTFSIQALKLVSQTFTIRAGSWAWIYKTA